MTTSTLLRERSATSEPDLTATMAAIGRRAREAAAGLSLAAAEAGGLALKSGNAAILRGGSESFHSSRALVAALQEGLSSAGLPADAIQLVPTRDRAAVGLMLAMSGVIDIIVPRGGASLIERVQRESRIPVIAHLEGLCHTYIDRAADPDKARQIVLNAKMRRVSICGATETLLVDRAVARIVLPPILADLRAEIG